jgi:hypothetical protein
MVFALAGCTATASTMTPPATTTAASTTNSVPTSSSTPAGTSSTVTSATVTSTPATTTTETGVVTTTTATTSPSTGNASTGETVVINNINFKGDAAREEADEYVEIQNWQDIPVDITGWVLKNVDSDVTFTFPSYTLEAYETVRVYTNEIHPAWGSFSFNHEGPIWDNENGNTAVLYDAQGSEISRRRY